MNEELNKQNSFQDLSERELYDLVVEMGEIMLQNGGEIFRTHETMLYTARSFGLLNFEAFIIANGIFTSVTVGGQIYSCQVRSVPLSAIELCRVEEINNLSRKVASGLITPEQLKTELHKVRFMKASSKMLQVLAAGVGAGAFCYLFDGSFKDSLTAFLAGVASYAVLTFLLPKLKLAKIIITIICSFIASFVCFAIFSMGFGDSVDRMIIGSIFPLVPGVPLTNAVRNIIENDYLSGVVRLVDALLTAGCIAIGVGVMMTLARLAGVGGF